MVRCNMQLSLLSDTFVGLDCLALSYKKEGQLVSDFTR
jgi:hypothetical protein